MSDKDSVQPPDRIWLRRGTSQVMPLSEIEIETIGVGDAFPYIRDDGDLISRSTVVKRLREVASGHAWGADLSNSVSKALNALADEFAASLADNGSRSAVWDEAIRIVKDYFTMHREQFESKYDTTHQQDLWSVLESAKAKSIEAFSTNKDTELK